MAAAGAPVRVPVAVALRVLSLSRQGYYQWLKNPVSQRDWDDAHLIDTLYGLHADDSTLGYRFLTDELETEHGIIAGENRVHRLCRVARIHASHYRKRSKPGSTGPAPHDDLLAVVDEHGVVRHEFVADGPNKLWLWDISEHATREGKLYVCAIKGGRFQGASATPLISWSSFSRGVWRPRVLRGRSLSCVATASISASVTALKSVPFG